MTEGAVLPVVAVVGRPNVGKSTLVNRILGRRESIVEERPGVTRDRIMHEAEWQGRTFLLVDTGGLEVDPSGELQSKVAGVARTAALEADVVAFVVDARDGLTAEDREVAELLRRSNGRVVLVANKADTQKREWEAVDLWELGFGEPVPVSALHGRGSGDLLDELTRDFPQVEPEAFEEAAVAIVGRPNVGKSSLFNRLVGAERSIVHDEPGTTRDAVDTVVEIDGELFRFVDTAGMRRSAAVDDSTEYFGNLRTARAIRRCDAALVVVDGAEGIARQDFRIAEQVAEAGRSAVLILNKVDLLEPAERRIEEEEVRRRLTHLDYAPLIRTCAVTGEGVDKIAPTLRRVLQARPTRIPTPLLNAVVQDLQARTPIPSKGVGARIKYAVQAEVSPPVIVLFGSGRLPEAWLRYLERSIRSRFGFEGTPIRFSFKGPAPKRGPASRRGRSQRARR